MQGLDKCSQCVPLTHVLWTAISNSCKTFRYLSNTFHQITVFLRLLSRSKTRILLPPLFYFQFVHSMCDTFQCTLVTSRVISTKTQLHKKQIMTTTRIFPKCNNIKDTNCHYYKNMLCYEMINFDCFLNTRTWCKANVQIS